MLKYAAGKKRLEEKLLKRRAAREEEFNVMGEDSRTINYKLKLK